MIELSGIHRVDRFENHNARRTTVKMSRQELDVMLDVELAIANRTDVHERPTVTRMLAVKAPQSALEIVLDEDELEEVG